MCGARECEKKADWVVRSFAHMCPVTKLLRSVGNLATMGDIAAMQVPRTVAKHTKRGAGAFVFRVPGPHEAAALAELGRTTFVSTFGHLYSAENLARFFATAYVVETIAGELIDPTLRWIVVEEPLAPGVPIGFCKLSVGTSLPVALADRSVMECKQLYLLDAYHGRGIADDLMQWAFTQAELVAAQDMVLCVYSGNLRAQRFYQRHGFTKLMDYHFMVGDHRDEEYILHCQLSP